MPKRAIGSYPLLLGHVAHINLDRELFRQKIKQVDIHIECPGSDRKPEPGYGQIECLLVSTTMSESVNL
jgi:hypothetical protein